MNEEQNGERARENVVDGGDDGGGGSEPSDDSTEQECRARDETSRSCCAHHGTEYVVKTRSWAKKIPIGLGLCPWAIKSCNKGLLRIVACECETPPHAAEVLRKEIESLTREGTHPLSTTLVVFPCVKMWREFEPFDEFVRSGIKRHLRSNDTVLEAVTLVAFHPNFLRWHGLAEEVGVGSVVQSHWGMIGQKSIQTATATIIETDTKAFGSRKVKIRYHDAFEGLGRQEQFVPTDWIHIAGEQADRTRMPLPDNVMHRSPYPTIHIIVNQDLASACIRDVSRVKRLNARRMAKLGWEGLERQLADDGGVPMN